VEWGVAPLVGSPQIVVVVTQKVTEKVGAVRPAKKVTKKD
jgi:hypothetical protein